MACVRPELRATPAPNSSDMRIRTGRAQTRWVRQIAGPNSEDGRLCTRNQLRPHATRNWANIRSRSHSGAKNPSPPHQTAPAKRPRLAKILTRISAICTGRRIGAASRDPRQPGPLRGSGLETWLESAAEGIPRPKGRRPKSRRDRPHEGGRNSVAANRWHCSRAFPAAEPFLFWS